ncbi:MAG: DUF5989 family protein [Pseudomonadota bacterium]|nr:DUF5989 family protein [Pseudomonadota bacterium]
MNEPAYTPGLLERLLLRLGTAGELLALLWRGGRWWMMPVVVILLGAAGLLLFLQSVHYVAPFVYMVF